ncbi:MAG TPA: ATP-binding protein [Usitatibacter sp.]|nr:ATP-binding protein [Usitatibacter sp.]
MLLQSETGRHRPRHRRGPLGPALLFLWLVLLTALPAAAPAETPAVPAAQPWRVVLIRDWDSQYPVNVVREKALRDALDENAPRVIEVYPEEIDTLRFSERIEGEYVDFLREKYRDLRIDVVIASGNEPLEFATRYRDAIWPGASIVFDGVIDGSLEGWKRPPRTTGLTMALDVKGAVELGRALAPGARRLYVVSGAADFDRFYLGLAQKALRGLEPPLDVRYIVGLPRREMLERVSRIEADSIVLYLTVLKDGDGQISGPGADTVGQVAARSKAPVVAAIQTLLRRGPAGVSSSRFDVHGRDAGLLVRTVLEGADPDRIPVKADPPPECAVDWKALERWGIAATRIPGHCAIVGHPLHPWEAYRWQFLALAATIVVEGALIGALVQQSRRRRRAEEAAAARRAELARVSRLSTLGALTASIAHEINQPMGAILTNADAAEMMLDRGTLDVSKLREILADIRGEGLRASEVIRGLRRLLSSRETRSVALDVNAEVAHALHHLALDAARRRVRLVPAFDPETPAILGDPVQLQQVVINLVANAMDALVSASDFLREVRIETRAHAGGAEIAVKDHGPGVAPEQAEALFESFHTSKPDGMGLGLAIVRNIVEMHGGRVAYEANMPHGAIFRVWLPAIGT